LQKGKIDLVVLGDATGRNFFNEIYAVYCAGTTCTCDITESDWPNDLVEQLIDPQGEGVYKVVTKHWVLGYEGFRTKPIFTYSIQRIKGGAKYSPVTRNLVVGPDFFDVTTEYADYYTAELLPKVEDAKKAVEGQYKSNEDQAEAEAAVQFAYDDYRRRILHDTKAGFDNALKWIGSPYRGVQSLAIRTMEEIDDNAAAAKLKEWSQSKDKGIADQAAPALSRWVERKAERGR